jgi:hypothetical protein
MKTSTVAAADGVRCARVRWEINFLLTFETAPFFCVYPVFVELFVTRLDIRMYVACLENGRKEVLAPE